MKRRKGGMLISISALILIGLSLLFWANYPKFGGKASREDIKTWEQLVEEETKKADRIIREYGGWAGTDK